LASGSPPGEVVTVPWIVPRGPVVQLGYLKAPTRVCQSATDVWVRYSLVYQNVQSSPGSIDMFE